MLFPEDNIVTQALVNKKALSGMELSTFNQLMAQGGDERGFTQTLVETTGIDERVVAKTIGEVFNMPMTTIAEESAKKLLDILPQNVIRKYRVIPVFRFEKELTVAFIDPLHKSLVEMLAQETGCKIVPVVTTISDFQAALKLRRSGSDELEKLPSLLSLEAFDIYKGGERKLAQLEAMGKLPPAGTMLEEILLRAVKSNASDIHLEPAEDEFRIRYRIDGILSTVLTLPSKLHDPITRVTKSKATMDIFETRAPQDGRFSVTFGRRGFDFRVNTLPTVYGEKAVMRVLAKSSDIARVDDLGFSLRNRTIFTDMLKEPNGMILVTGPTASGKTTTLFASLNEYKSASKNFMTIENPVEYRVDFINQVQVDPEKNLSFAAALRATLRQDPNVILVGEIRDSETGMIAMEAALTGHLVLSTVQANDAIGAIARLLSIGIPAHWVAPSLIGIVAQRLVRKICPQCIEEYKPSDELRGVVGLSLLKDAVTFFYGKGCAYCNTTGYKGRTAIHEVLIVNEKIRDLIYQQVSSSKIREEAVKSGFRDLRFDGLKKVLAGVTAIDEVLRVTRVVV
jgi:type IV pilus assembly protein PilB